MKSKKPTKGDEIVLDLENSAESENYHDMCSVYRTLYELLLETINEKDATEIMRKIRDDYNGFIR